MSLLQDALKRQQEEQAARGGPPTRNAAPPPLPSSAEPEPSPATSTKSPSHKPTHREWVAAAVLIGGLALLLLIIGLLVFLLRGGTHEEQPVVERPVLTDPPVPPPVQITEDTVEEEPSIEKPPETSFNEMDDAVAETHPAFEDRAAPVTEISPATRIDEESIRIPRWPEIRVQAAMGMGETGTVMINGTILRVGDRFEEIKIVEITDRGILMEYQGEQRLIPVRR